jgi:hypothetical protein
MDPNNTLITKPNRHHYEQGQYQQDTTNCFFIEQEVLKPLLEIYLNAEKVKGSYKARSRNKQQIVFKTRLQ